MHDERPILRVEDDPDYRFAMDEARELRIHVETYQFGTNTEPEWHVFGSFDTPDRVRGRWVDDVWVDSDDDYYGQPEPIRASSVADSPSAGIRSVIRSLINQADI